MTNAIETRYGKENRAVLRGFGYLHPSRISQQDASKHAKVAADWYEADIENYSLERELLLIRKSLILSEIIEKAEADKRRPSLHDLHRALLTEPECFPSIGKMCKLAITLPLTSASVERSFSKLKITKNRLRSTMKQDRLYSLMLMSVESDITKSLDIEDLVKRFSDNAPRRWDLY